MYACNCTRAILPAGHLFVSQPLVRSRRAVVCDDLPTPRKSFGQCSGHKSAKSVFCSVCHMHIYQIPKVLSFHSALMADFRERQTNSRNGQSSHGRQGRDHEPRERRSRSPSKRSALLPFEARHLSKTDLTHHKTLFGLYLDVQKGLDIDALDFTELRGRWKSFIGKWYASNTFRSPPIDAYTAQEPWRASRRVVRMSIGRSIAHQECRLI